MSPHAMVKSPKKCFLFLSITFCSAIHLYAFDSETSSSIDDLRGEHVYHGLASYYNNLQYIKINAEGFETIDESSNVVFEPNDTLIILGRYDAVTILFSQESEIIINNNTITLSEKNRNSYKTINHKISLVALERQFPQLAPVRYRNTPRPIRFLAKIIESLLLGIGHATNYSWGLAILLLALAIKIILLPLAILTNKVQRRTAEIQSILEPKVIEIKSALKGEEAHNKIMEVHKEISVTPFYALKPLILTLIQFPILIAIFNVLGEMHQFEHTSFLWIRDLAHPDSIFFLGFSVPLLGNTINLLPFIMTAISILAAFYYRNKFASKVEIRKQKRQLFFMSAAFFILFYPFPSSMVLYWSTSNLLHIFQQKIIKI